MLISDVTITDYLLMYLFSMTSKSKKINIGFFVIISVLSSVKFSCKKFPTIVKEMIIQFPSTMKDALMLFSLPNGLLAEYVVRREGKCFHRHQSVCPHGRWYPSPRFFPWCLVPGSFQGVPQSQVLSQVSDPRSFLVG